MRALHHSRLEVGGVELVRNKIGVKAKPKGFLDHLIQNNNQASFHSAFLINSSVLFAYVSLSQVLYSVIILLLLRVVVIICLIMVFLCSR